MNKLKNVLLTIFTFVISIYAYGQEENIQKRHIDSLSFKNYLAQSDSLLKIRSFDLALEKLDSAKNIYNNPSQKEYAQHTLLLHKIGILYYYQTKIDSAIFYFEEAYKAREEYYKEPHHETANSLNNLANCYIRTGEYHKAIPLHEKSLSIRQSTLPDRHNDLGISLNNLGVCYKNTGAYNKALNFLNQALQIRESNKGYLSKDVADTKNNIAGCYLLKGNIHSALIEFKESLNIKLEIFEDNHPSLSDSYSNIGICYYDLGNYEKAISHQLQALSVAKSNWGEIHPSVAQSYINLGVCYFDLMKFDKTIKYNLDALKISTEIFGDNNPFLDNLYAGLASGYWGKKDHENSMYYYNATLRERRKIYGDDHPFIADVYQNIALVHKNNEEMDSAIIYNQLCIAHRKTNLGEIHPDMATVYINQGDCYKKINETDSAIVYYNAALIANGINENFSTPPLSRYVAIMALERLGTAYLNKYKEEQSETALNESHKYLIKASENISLYRKKMIESRSKELIAVLFKTAIEENITVKNILVNQYQKKHLLYEIFDAIENSKARTLHENLKESTALSIAKIPDSLTTLEFDLSIEISQLDLALEAKRIDKIPETDSSFLAISSKLLPVQKQYEQLKQDLEDNYPNYYKARYDLSTVTLQEVQEELLTPDQTLLEYMVGDSSIFIFLVQSDTFDIYEIKNNFQLEQQVNDITKNGLYGYHTAPAIEKTGQWYEESIINYADAAVELYQQLIAPVADRLTEKLIVVPDGVLGYIPFEALLSATPEDLGDFATYPYLIKKHQISYAYSATLLKEMTQRVHQHRPTQSVLAMAPFYLKDPTKLLDKWESIETSLMNTSRDSLGHLKGSGDEVAGIKNILNGTALFGPNASLTAFQESAEEYKILHLSTHGKADDRVGDYAYLAFGVPDQAGAFDKLYARDLYNYALNADMVVLSACETGIGKLQQGEGIVSLARAFAYAGAKSIFTTLWQVNDESTKELMIPFYGHLKKASVTKDAALRMAKLDYLNDKEKDNHFLHPFFWSGMIGIGDMSPIKK